MFEKASKLKLRFTTSKGLITVEDLWDFRLTGLDSIAKDLYRKLKESDVESFVVKTSKKDELIQLRFDIVKHIIDRRLKSAEMARKTKATKERKQRIMAIIEEKEDQSLKDASIEDLRKMLDGSDEAITESEKKEGDPA